MNEVLKHNNSSDISRTDDQTNAFHNSTRLSGTSLKQVVENYLLYYASGQSHTAKAKNYDLKYFIQYISEKTRKDPEKVLVSDWTLQITKDFIDQRLELAEAPATVSRRLATIKHFGRTLAERIPDYINPAREVKGPVIQNTKPHSLGLEEVNLLRKAAQLQIERTPESFAALRNQVLIELLLSTGLRADEVRLLKISQISPDLTWLKNVKTKGRKFRNVYLDEDIRRLLRHYLLKREEQLFQRFNKLRDFSKKELAKLPVLCSHHRALVENPASFGLAPKTIWRIVANLGKKAQSLSLTPMMDLHPHLLRHTFAHGLLDSSKDVRLVAQALGHSDVRVTMRYTERSDEEIADALEKKRRSQRRKTHS